MLKLFSIITFLAPAFGCMSSSKQLEIINDKEVRVPAEAFVKEGDKVTIFEDRCNLPYRAKTRQCWPEKIGSGKVVDVSDRRALIHADDAVKFTKDTYVKWSYEQQ